MDLDVKYLLENFNLKLEKQNNQTSYDFEKLAFDSYINKKIETEEYKINKDLQKAKELKDAQIVTDPSKKAEFDQ